MISAAVKDAEVLRRARVPTLEHQARDAVPLVDRPPDALGEVALALEVDALVRLALAPAPGDVVEDFPREAHQGGLVAVDDDGALDLPARAVAVRLVVALHVVCDHGSFPSG
jgi:hypothetical protein